MVKNELTNAVTRIFLFKNDYELAMSNDEAYELTMRVAEDNLGKDELTTILKNYITKLI
ncbi:MAG: hypothetical protein PUP91_24705 [Rhizonema sp. PD37]|nr:hypothetical protein [Rhizonema sp. PD37]